METPRARTLSYILIFLIKQLLNKIYSSHEIHTILPQDSTNFYKTDKDFRTLMKATYRNPNILKCCQRKSKKINIIR